MIRRLIYPQDAVEISSFSVLHSDLYSIAQSQDQGIDEEDVQLEYQEYIQARRAVAVIRDIGRGRPIDIGQVWRCRPCRRNGQSIPIEPGALWLELTNRLSQ
jgi:hypothetical protein